MIQKHNDSFAIRAYSKKELALTYFPTATTPHAAVNHLMAWVRHCTPLYDELLLMGYEKTSKYFTPRQVERIVHYIGEP